MIFEFYLKVEVNQNLKIFYSKIFLIQNFININFSFLYSFYKT